MKRRIHLLSTGKSTNGGYVENLGINNKETKMFEDENEYDSMDSVYQQYWSFHSQMMDKHDVMEIAAIIVTQGMMMYKTILDPEEYDAMATAIYNSRDTVQKLTQDQGVLH